MRKEKKSSGGKINCAEINSEKKERTSIRGVCLRLRVDGRRKSGFFFLGILNFYVQLFGVNKVPKLVLLSKEEKKCAVPNPIF